MTLLGNLGKAWRSPALIWPRLRQSLGFALKLRLRLMARWNGTRLVLPRHLRQEHPVRIQGKGTLRLGEGVGLGFALAGSLGHPILLQPREAGSEIHIGGGAQIMNGCELIALEMIEIGPNCRVGPDCRLMDSNFHQLDPERRGEPGRSAPIRIGENAWLGSRVTVLKGVEVGRDAVLASGAVVTRSVPEGAIVAGCPARVIGSVHA